MSLSPISITFKLSADILSLTLATLTMRIKCAGATLRGPVGDPGRLLTKGKRGSGEAVPSASGALNATVVLLDFVPLLQAELDEFRRFWNHHRVRSQPEKNMPSGHVPYNASDHPQNYGRLDHRIPVPQKAVGDLRKMVTENVGPREDHLSWIGKPELSLSTAWDGFQAMLEPMANIMEVS
ncbi:hypothetical protein DFH09DRAFT_1077029 [Mycena vulgaris]|nr:hypothetical protein DFH09DRAFT_1077029 [Mycena vulgaris]